LDQKQTEVWAAVAGGSTASVSVSAAPAAPAPLSQSVLAEAISSEAPTQSLSQIYESSRVGGSVDSFVDQVQRRFAYATSGLKGERVCRRRRGLWREVAWSDIFASGDLFSSVLEQAPAQLCRRKRSRVPRCAKQRHLTKRANFCAGPMAAKCRKDRSRRVPLARITEGPLALIELDALQPKTMTLHTASCSIAQRDLSLRLSILGRRTAAGTR